MTIDQVGFRLYRNGVINNPLVQPGLTRVVYQPAPACGFYPLMQLLGAQQAAVDPWGYSYTHLNIRQASELDINLLTLTPPLSEGEAIALRQDYYDGVSSVAKFGDWAYICADFPIRIDPIAQPNTYQWNDLLRFSGKGWDAGAVSAKAFFGSGRVKFRVQAGKRFVVGLQGGTDPTIAASRFFGFVIDDVVTRDLMRTGFDEGSITSGNSPSATNIPYPDSEEFTVEILNNVLSFTRGTSFASSYPLTGAFAAPGVWSLGAVIWEDGTWVEGIEVVGYSGSAGRFAPLAGRAGAGVPKSGSASKLPTLTGTGRVATRSAASLPRLKGRGGRIVAESYGSLPALTGYGTTEWTSSTAPRSRGFLPGLMGYGHSNVGTVGRSAGSLAAMKARGTQGNKADSLGKFAPLSGFAVALPRDEARMYSHNLASDALRPFSEFAVVINSTGNISTALAIGLVKGAALDTTATLSDAFTLSSILAALMESEVTVGADVPLYERGNEVWVVNLAENHATSTFEDYPFNSYGVIGGRAFGAKQDGLFLLEGDDDAGAPIRASVSYGKQDFGTPAMKNMSRAYVGASSTGKLYLKVIAGGKEYLYAARAASPEMAQMRFDVGRGLQANYFTFELFNKNGGDFEIDSVSFFAAEFKRRI